MSIFTQETEPTAKPTFSEIVARLSAAQKTSVGAPAYSRFVNRPMGRQFAAAGYLLGLTPNMVTALSAFFSFAGIAVIALVNPSWVSGIATCLLLVLGYGLDAADGQLARLRGGGSPSGEWLDHMVDATKISCLHLAVLISFYRFIDLPARAFLLVPIGFAIVAAVMFFGMILNDLLRRIVTAGTGQAIDRGTTSGLRSVLVMPTDYGLLCVVFVLLGAPVVFAWVYLAIFVANAGFMTLAAVKWFTDMKRLSEPGNSSVRNMVTVQGNTS